MLGPFAVETEKVFRYWDYPLFGVLTLLNLGATGYLFHYWFAEAGPSGHPVVFSLLTLPLLLALAAYEVRWLTLPLMRRPRREDPSPGQRVGVATTFVPGLEPIEMLEETLSAMVSMHYPHDTWVLDEGDSPEVKALCHRLGVCHFSRKHMSQYQMSSGSFAARTKHGNYNAWLAELGYSEYDIIVAFDPDHIPHRRFLIEVLGYFKDPKIGYVQAAQFYYNQSSSFIARGAAEETYAYYSSIQMTSFALGYPIVTGCHNAHRAYALREVGGFAAHDADDLLITILYRVAGWKGVYVPDKLAVGLVPVDWSGYLKQQRRWARSVLDVKVRIFPRLAKRLPRLERAVSFLHGLYYLHGLQSALSVCVLCYMLVTRATPAVFSLASLRPLFVLSSVFLVCDFYRQRFFLDRRREFGLHWRAAILRFAKWPQIALALKDALWPRTRAYAVTAKVRTVDRSHSVAPGHLIVAALVSICWMTGTFTGGIGNPLLHIAAACLVVASTGVALTELLPSADPFDPELAKRGVESMPASEHVPL